MSCIQGQWEGAKCPRNSKLSPKNLELLKFPEQQELKVRAVRVLVAPSCLTLCDPMDCSLPVSSVHRILQARILEWVAIPFSRGSLPDPDMKPRSPAVAGRSFTIQPPGKPKSQGSGWLFCLHNCYVSFLTPIQGWREGNDKAPIPF